MTMRSEIEDKSIIFTNMVTFITLPKTFVDRFADGITSPSVLNCTRYLSPLNPLTVIDFVNGANGQEIKILGNGNLTVSNNSKIKTNTGANKVLVANKVYTFTLFTDVWYEDE